MVVDHMWYLYLTLAVFVVFGAGIGYASIVGDDRMITLDEERATRVR